MIAHVPDSILVLNAGSSSLKFALFGIEGERLARRLHGQVERLGSDAPLAYLQHSSADDRALEAWNDGAGPRDATAALQWVATRLERLDAHRTIRAVGHRVVHGGARFVAPIEVTPAVRCELSASVALAPLHHPANLAGIDAAAAWLPGVPQVACFDTAFHHGKPWIADTYAIPRAYYDQGIRRYGFHGISYEYVLRYIQEQIPGIAEGRLVLAHLGHGASLCAVRLGRPVESTMGFTALDGLPMSTRCGQIDPGVLLHLLGQPGMSVQRLTDMLYKESGLLGLSGVSGDMRVLLESRRPEAHAAVEYFVARVASGVGHLAASLGGVDAIVFTAGIGEHSAVIRARILEKLAWLGFEVDAERNQAAARCITRAESCPSAWVVPTDEELMIAQHTQAVLKGQSRMQGSSH